MQGSRSSWSAAVAVGALWMGASAVSAGVGLTVVQHLTDARRPDAVWASGGAVRVRAGGETWRRYSGGFVRETAILWPDDLDAVRAARGRDLAAWTPMKDRWLSSPGLRSAAVRGACPIPGGELCWYGVAAPGLSVVEKGVARDLKVASAVLDADVDAEGRIWAVTSEGLISGSASGAEPIYTTTAPAPVLAPGNSVDGAFVHEQKLYVFGPRGLHAAAVTTGTTSPPEFGALLDTPVPAAAATPGGFAALSGGRLWLWPGGTAHPVPVSGAWSVAGAADRRVFVATATGLSSVGPGRPAPVADAALPAPPRAMCGAGDLLAIALAGPDGGVLTGRTSGAGADARLAMTRHELDAACFLARPDGTLLVGTQDGLASIEGERMHWFLREPGLGVTAIAVVRDTVVLATGAGLAALDGPFIVARAPLGHGPGARVTALVPYAGDLWATTAGHGIYRVRVTGDGSASR